MSGFVPSRSMDRFARVLLATGRAWNGFEVVGAEHVPRSGPALYVMYHGFMPLDGWFFSAWHWRERGRMVRGLGDRFLFEIPGFNDFIRAGGAVPGEPGAARDLLRAGEVVLVSPGGVREALVSRRDHYRVVWGDRLGFARLALEAGGVPVIPIFGENVEELYRAPGSASRPAQALYEATRWPIVPITGLGLLPWPVKLRMHVGAPVAYDPEGSPEALRDATRDALQALMDAHQPPRPRRLRGLLQRLG